MNIFDTTLEEKDFESERIIYTKFLNGNVIYSTTPATYEDDKRKFNSISAGEIESQGREGGKINARSRSKSIEERLAGKQSMPAYRYIYYLNFL